MHDALVKPMPGNLMAPSLAESWTVSADQRIYEFKLREGLKFHNGDPFTAEDVKFSFHRAKGAKILHEKVREVDGRRARTACASTLHEPWPDFMTFYGTLVTGAGWIVPKKYVEQVGDDGFKKHPIGLGPYKFVSHTPGHRAGHGGQRELLAQDALGEAPRLQERARSRPRALAMLKRGEVDVAYLLEVPQAQEVKTRSQPQAGLLRRHRRPSSSTSSTSGIPKSPWARPARAAGRQLRASTARR